MGVVAWFIICDCWFYHWKIFNSKVIYGHGHHYGSLLLIFHYSLGISMTTKFGKCESEPVRSKAPKSQSVISAIEWRLFTLTIFKYFHNTNNTTETYEENYPLASDFHVLCFSEPVTILQG